MMVDGDIVSCDVTDGRLSIDRRATVGLLVGLHLLATTMVVLTHVSAAVPLAVTTPPIVLALSFVPGALLLLSLERAADIDATWVTYALGLSLLLLMLLGLLVNVVLPVVGIDRPLSVAPLAVSISLLVATLAVGALLVRNGGVTVGLPSLLDPTPLTFLLLPALSAIAISIFNRTGENLPLLALLTAVALVPFAVYLWGEARWHALGIWTLALAVLYHDSLDKSSTFSGNPVVVYIWNEGRWIPGTEVGGRLSTELLQHGTIFPMYARLTDLGIMTQMTVVNPLFVSFIPLALFIAFRQYVDSDLAYLAASLLVVAHPFYNQYPTAGRAATPVLFLALFAVVLTDGDIHPRSASFLALFFGTGIVVTHYGTSYFVMVAFVGAMALLVLLWGLTDVRDGALRDGVESVRVRSKLVFEPIKRQMSGAVFSWSLATFYVVVTFSWYLYTNAGRAFALFPRHLSRSLEQLLSDSPEVGRTGARLQRDYGSEVIYFSKRIYMFIGVLMIVGFSVAYYRRFRHENEHEFDDSFLAISTAMFALFGTTVFIRTWGGGRPMMITFVFTAVFAVFGVLWLGRALELACDMDLAPNIPVSGETVAMSMFAVLLAVLLVLNSGVATAAGLDARAPSQIPVQGEDYQETDLSTHAWVIDNREDGNVYGDHIAFGQTDWLLPAIATRTGGPTAYGGERPRNKLDQLTRPEAESGYLLLLGHNEETGSFDRYASRQPIDVVRPEYRENEVYTTGRSTVYYFDTDAGADCHEDDPNTTLSFETPLCSNGVTSSG
ncbi:hypothetical protein BRC90_01215 [Halobacteriales archaeon QS_4_69_34]|nr:MAG: hypothetical protein BRC90_01215 [Halobacteriales archaeon QS_4_69_34]